MAMEEARKATRRIYPYGRVREDSVAQILRDRIFAETIARVMKHMTGEPCFVEPLGGGSYIILRCTGERWVRA